MLVSMLPALPSFPEFPLDLDWQYDEASGRYTLDEAGADQILDYRDNTLEQYRFRLEVYQKEVDSISSHIEELNL